MSNSKLVNNKTIEKKEYECPPFDECLKSGDLFNDQYQSVTTEDETVAKDKIKDESSPSSQSSRNEPADEEITKVVLNDPEEQIEALSDSNNPDEIVEILLTEQPKFRYSLFKDNDRFGYYLNDSKGPSPLSNFYITFSKWVKGIRDGEPLSYYEGKVYFKDDNTINFDRLAASTFEEASSFRKFIGNLCGPKALIKGTPNELIKAIKTFNKNVPLFEEKEFGYNETLMAYFAEDMKITAEAIKELKSPIKYSDQWGHNKLGFKSLASDDISRLKNFIADKLLTWDNPKVMFNLLSFTFLPIIYPFLKSKNPNKFYFMLKGPSGAGKSQVSKWMQSFFGNFQSLLPWTSTETSINIVGSAFKDALLVVDDLKAQSFKSERDVRRVMMTLQNYSDGTGKQRSNVDLKLRDERVIKGHLLISAEDLVITETSTIARGIIIDVISKKVNHSQLSEIDKASSYFSSFTPYYIQHVMKNYNKEKVEQLFEAAHNFISSHPLINDPSISQDNLARMINNFAAQRTSWKILSDFLFEDKSDEERKSFQETFDHNLIILLLKNLERINLYKPEVVFETTLWEQIQNRTFSLRRVESDGDLEIGSLNDHGKIIGYYTQDISGNINLVIQISSALREMKRTLENFAISEDTLKVKLLQEKKIKINQSKKVSLNGRKISGVQWTGPIPKSIFGLKEEDDPVEQAAEILSSSSFQVSEDENVIF